MQRKRSKEGDALLAEKKQEPGGGVLYPLRAKERARLIAALEGAKENPPKGSYIRGTRFGKRTIEHNSLRRENLCCR